MTTGFNRFPEIAERFGPALAQVVKKTALDVQALAASNAPVDTGFLRNSIYTVTSQGSTYGDAGSPPGDSYLLPEVGAPSDEYTAYVAAGANYAAYVNYGTRFMVAQPFWEPAIDAGQAALEAAMSKFESML